MNRVVLNEQDPTLKRKGNTFLVRDPQVLEHLMGHLLVKKGDQLKVLVVGEGLGTATVQKTAPEEVALEVSLESEGALQNINLLVAAARPPTVKKVLEHGTSFGVKSFSFFKAELSEKSYLTSRVFETASVNDLLTKGLAQGSSFCQMPTVSRHQKIEGALDSLEDNSDSFLLSLSTEKTFQDYSFHLDNPINLAIGPERGWTTAEERLLVQRGFQPVLIGNSTLRVEIATFAALGQLAMLALK